MILLDEQSKEEAQQLQSAALHTWLSEPETKASLQFCADIAMKALHSDKTLRVPRSVEQRENGFAAWRNEWHARLGNIIQETFTRQLSGLAYSLRLPHNTIKDAVVEYVWTQAEAELMAFALEGLARTWVRRHMGDATTIGRPRLETNHWVVPLGIEGIGNNLGQVTLDVDGNVLEAASSSRSDILAHIP